MSTDKDYVYDSSVHSHEYVLSMLEQGAHPLCPRCKARLIVALTPEDAKRQKTNPGMRCPVNPRHFESTVYLRDEDTDDDLSGVPE